MYKEINKCRICGNADLDSILSLGNQVLTGVFPKTKEEAISSGPLELVKCREKAGGDSCGLVQLKCSYDCDEMYGDNYGYRSGLNRSMVRHLQGKVKKIIEVACPVSGDIILDIGSNDSTLLQAYPKDKFVLVGMDPTGKKFKEYYPDHIQLIPDFFSAESFRKRFGGKKARIITSIAMFYDLESPVDFMKGVHEILDDDGIWVFEQIYMPTTLEKNGYDIICHEHLEYYRLKEIKWMADRVGFKIVDVEFNNINGGSFSVTVAKSGSSHRENTALVKKVLGEEEGKGLGTLKPYLEFKQHIHDQRQKLRRFIQKAKSENKKIMGYAASTKGNVILQFCNLTDRDISCIAEVNSDKFGCYTPGTLIPIIPEEEAKAMQPDYFLILPWSFKEDFAKKEKEYLKNGGMLLVPLPEIEVITG